jgi:hypothetical protein
VTVDIGDLSRPAIDPCARDQRGGREVFQLFRDWKQIRRVDDCLAFPARQSLRNLAVLPERDCQDDRVGLDCILQRPGDDRGTDRPSLRGQRLGRTAARDGHVDVLAGEGLGEGLAYLAESNDRVADDASPVGQTCDMPPSTTRSMAAVKRLSSEAR